MNAAGMLLIAREELRRVSLVETCPKRGYLLGYVRFEVSARMTSAAGRAWVTGPRRGLVRLSLPIFDHPDNAHRAEAELRDTVRHELAHVTTPGSKHGSAWRRVAISYGDSGDRCHDLALPEVPKYRAVRASCSGCDFAWSGLRQSFARFRRDYEGRRHACGGRLKAQETDE